MGNLLKRETGEDTLKKKIMNKRRWEGEGGKYPRLEPHSERKRGSWGESTTRILMTLMSSPSSIGKKDEKKKNLSAKKKTRRDCA